MFFTQDNVSTILLNNKDYNIHSVPFSGKASDWEQYYDFIPKEGDMIIFTPDAEEEKYRIKIGNGITPLGELEFIKLFGDGTSITHSWNGTVLTVTSASGTSSADLKGDDGITPHIGSNGNWWIGNTDTGVSASGSGSGSGGLTEAQITALDNLFKVCAFIKADVSAEYNAFKTAFGIENSGGEEEPDEPATPEVTLSSISATYSGGEVAVGTAVTDLTGIVVTAHYSDGSTETVTGYTLSGEIAEGSNTITVSYGGKTMTFTVTGVAAEVTSLRGIQLPAVPSNFSTNENWQYSGNGGNLCSVIGAARYLYLGRVFTGTVYVRTLTKSAHSSIPTTMHLVAEDYITNQTAEGEALAAASTVRQFDGQFLKVYADGTHTATTNGELDGGDGGMVALQRFDIPDGRYAILAAANAGNNNGNAINVDGWNTVFFEDPTNNIAITEVYE